MTKTASREFLRLLTVLRKACSLSEEATYFMASGRCYGYLSALFEAGLIDFEQYGRLQTLIWSASKYHGRPFPDARNAGPVMPASVKFDRLRGVPASVDAQPPVQAAEPFVDEAEYLQPCPTCEGNSEVGWAPCSLCAGTARVPVDVTPQSKVSANEPEKVPAPTARPGLRLLCLLVETRTGEKRSLPVHTLQPLPPRNRLHGKWTVDRYPCFVLRETQAKPASAEVLARCERHRQANALRPALGSVRAGDLSHAR